MKHIFILSGDYIELGNEEVSSLLDIGNSKLHENLLISELPNDEKGIMEISKRLALTKNIYRLLFECKADEIIDCMKNYGWNSVYNHDFCLRIVYAEYNEKNSLTKNSIDVKFNKKIKSKQNYKIKINKDSDKIKKCSEKELAGYIWRSVKKPKVNLENAKTKIGLFFIKNKVYCGLMIYENKEDFESRKAHLRPFPHPSSLHPKVARALINISEIRENEILLDPFCGTGGLNIEAGLMKIKNIGYDINKTMIKGCKDNLEHFKIKNYKIKHQNALEIADKFDYAVTDLPYGLNSNAMAMYEKDWKKHRINKKIETKDFIKNLEKFYLLFLKSLRKKLKKKAVIIFPSYVNYKKLLKESKFRTEKEFSIYVHRSLTRKIVKFRLK